MRDLSARLREIVRRETSAAPPRELTYVADPAADRPREDAAARLGGRALTPDGACVVIDCHYPSDRSHGRKRIDSLALSNDAPIALFDPRLHGEDGWSRRTVFFDIETTGLSGGAGTIAFLAGCGWLDDSGFTVRQFFLAGPSGEPAMLEALADVMRGASLLVTFNGRTFDLPFMETRWAYHRTAAPTEDVPHFDMLPPARRLWARREATLDRGDCSLTALERAVLGFHRIGDVPGLEIPARYFHFLRTGDASAVAGVLDHNRLDLVSLAAITAHALWLAQEGPAACREPGECVALGRLYERAGQVESARRSYEIAAATDRGEARRHALARLAVLLRREGQYDEAAEAWQGVLDLAPRGTPLTALDRRAVEALAIHHEHRAKDLAAAERYARTLDAHASVREKAETDHRLQRIDRKLRLRGGLL